MPKAQQSATILIVEDEVLTRINLADQLRDNGFSVVEASSGPHALEVLKSGSSIDLVLSDIMMPGEPDGLGLMQWIRAALPKLPVILTSGDVEKGKTARRLCAEDHFVPKPYDVSDLIERIKRLLH